MIFYETFLLNSSFESNDKYLMIEGYNLIKCDLLGNTLRAGAHIYQKEFFAVHAVNITFLWNYNTKQKTICYCVYRSPSQSSPEFKSFLSSLEDLLSNVICSVLIPCHFRWLQSQITSLVVQGHYYLKWHTKRLSNNNMVLKR